jgi:MFS family permease
MSPVSPLLPTLGDHFAVSVSTVTWVLTSYLLTMAGFVLVGGRLGDMFGHRQVFAWGTVVFTTGSLLSSLTPSLMALLAFRAIQGIGTALVLGNSLAVLADAFPEGRRGRAVGVAVMGSALGSLSGLIVASVSIQYLDWRLLFYMMTLGGVISMVLALRLLHFPGTHARQEGQRFDLVGAILLFGALVALVITPYHLHGGEASYQAGLPYHVATFGTFLVLSGLFVVVERRHTNPLVNLGHLRHIPFSFSIASNVVLHWNMAVTMMLPFSYTERTRVGALVYHPGSGDRPGRYADVFPARRLDL